MVVIENGTPTKGQPPKLDRVQWLMSQCFGRHAKLHRAMRNGRAQWWVEGTAGEAYAAEDLDGIINLLTARHAATTLRPREEQGVESPQSQSHKGLINAEQAAEMVGMRSASAILHWRSRGWIKAAAEATSKRGKTMFLFKPEDVKAYAAANPPRRFQSRSFYKQQRAREAAKAERVLARRNGAKAAKAAPAVPAAVAKKAAVAKPRINTRSVMRDAENLDVRIVGEADLKARLDRIVDKVNTTTPFEATLASVARAALRAGLDQLEKEYA